MLYEPFHKIVSNSIGEIFAITLYSGKSYVGINDGEYIAKTLSHREETVEIRNMLELVPMMTPAGPKMSIMPVFPFLKEEVMDYAIDRTEILSIGEASDDLKKIYEDALQKFQARRAGLVSPTLVK